MEHLGKFDRLIQPGCNNTCCCIEAVVGRVSLRIQQLSVQCETKTQDNVFVNVTTVIQYQVLPDLVYDSFYILNNPITQIQSYVFDAVRSIVPIMDLDEVFEQREELALQVKKSLKDTLRSFGFVILHCLVTDITPAEKVKNAMNQINESTRIRDALKVLICNRA